MIRKIKIAVEDLIKLPVIYMPGMLGRRLRSWFWSRRFKKCGKNLMIDEGVIIQGSEWISVGDDVWIDKYCVLIAGPVNMDSKIVKNSKNDKFEYLEGELVLGDKIHLAPFCIIQAHGGVFIGSNSSFSSGVKVYSLSNLPNDPFNPRNKIFFTSLDNNSAYHMSPVVLDENVGAALNVIILPGVYISKNSFITPNSVVMTSFGTNSYICGNPAKKIRERFKLS